MFELTNDEKQQLLGIARKSINSRLNDIENHIPSGSGNLSSHNGAFVTLNINGNLRGCIGRMSSDLPLAETVWKMAQAAAFDDPRFLQITKLEWPQISIEISILTPLQPCTDFDTIEIGKHGLYISKDFRSGVLLPQVPVQWNWDRSTFLKQICRKAGLDEDELYDKDTELFTFEAIIISEENILE